MCLYFFFTKGLLHHDSACKKLMDSMNTLVDVSASGSLGADQRGRVSKVSANLSKSNATLDPERLLARQYNNN